MDIIERLSHDAFDFIHSAKYDTSTLMELAFRVVSNAGRSLIDVSGFSSMIDFNFRLRDWWNFERRITGLSPMLSLRRFRYTALCTASFSLSKHRQCLTKAFVFPVNRSQHRLFLLKSLEAQEKTSAACRTFLHFSSMIVLFSALELLMNFLLSSRSNGPMLWPYHCNRQTLRFGWEFILRDQISVDSFHGPNYDCWQLKQIPSKGINCKFIQKNFKK